MIEPAGGEGRFGGHSMYGRLRRVLVRPPDESFAEADPEAWHYTRRPDLARARDQHAHLVGLLERRLDAVVYRSKFVPTVFAARQLVNHGHVQVNGKRVNIPSYQVKDGDVISLREKAQQMGLVLEAAQSGERDTPDYIEVDHSKMTATYLREPSLGDVPYPVQMEPNLVVEFYAQN